MVKMSDFRTTFIKTSLHVLNQNVMSQENYPLPEVDQGFIFSIEGVEKIVDLHKKLCHMFQARSGGANHLCTCIAHKLNCLRACACAATQYIEHFVPSG